MKKTLPPKPPLSRVIRRCVRHLCTNCGSTMPKSGFLMLFGKRYCDNDKCPNSKPLKKNIVEITNNMGDDTWIKYEDKN